MINTDTANISDGDHTFEELYDHRSVLFASLCNCFVGRSWKTRLYEDGSKVEDGYFLCGIDDGAIRYHIKDKYWDLFKCDESPVSPKWDGSSPDDCLEELKKKFCSGGNLAESYLFDDLYYSL